uniref:DUF7087 domain-containing protein n=1 Tax=Ditylenchus dipsaci TaxID=166011 RepID=A0A915CPJ0_9BILA
MTLNFKGLWAALIREIALCCIFSVDKSKMASHRTIDYSFGNVINQMRSAQLFSLIVQGVVLYLDSGRIGLSAFLIPFAVIICNMYIVGMRYWAPSTAQYAAELFGGFLLALLAHFLSPEVESGVSSVLYNLSDYLSISTGFCCAGVEIYEGFQHQFLRSIHCVYLRSSIYVLIWKESSVCNPTTLLVLALRLTLAFVLSVSAMMSLLEQILNRSMTSSIRRTNRHKKNEFSYTLLCVGNKSSRTYD